MEKSCGNLWSNLPQSFEHSECDDRIYGKYYLRGIILDCITE